MIGRVRGLWAWVRDRTGRRRAARETDEEFRFHIDMEIEKNLRAGVEAAEARRQALIAFGGAERHKERLREGRSLPILDALGSDLRFALRSLKCTTPAGVYKPYTPANARDEATLEAG